MITIIDVIENYFINLEDKNLLTIPGKELYKFGEEVRRFASAYVLPKSEASKHPVYLGGWGSANFWNVNESSLVFSSLLYSGQILVKDPISDWFSVEQYKMQSLLSSRQGYINPLTGESNVFKTRCFLSIVIPQILRLKPLIQKGIIVLVPSKSFMLNNQHKIEMMSSEIANKVTKELDYFKKTFSPNDLAVDDNRRGLFMFTKGLTDDQISRHIRQSTDYFSSDYLLSSVSGYYYTSVFNYESYLCEKGVNDILLSLPGTKIINAILNSDLSIYRGLTPEIIADIRDDDNFAQFRMHVSDVYKNIPQTTDSDILKKIIAELEETYIAPVLAKIQDDVSKGALSKIGLQILESGIRIAGGVLTGGLLDPSIPAMKYGIASLATELLSVFTNQKSSKNGNVVIWERLFNHRQNTINQFNNYSPVEAKGAVNNSWDINIENPLSISLTSGTILMDIDQNLIKIKSAEKFPPENIYDICPCKSGRQFKFCCKGLEKRKGI